MNEREWTVLVVGMLVGAILMGVVTISSTYIGFQKFKERNECVAKENMDKIMAVFAYCQGYYDEAQEWWNSPVGGDWKRIFPPTMKFGNETMEVSR